MRTMPSLPAPRDMPTEVKVIIDAIGHSVRTEILRQLAERPLGVRELADATGTVVSQVRKHLAILEDLGLVIADVSPDERRPGGRGRAVLWSTNPERAKEVGKMWIDYVTGRSSHDVAQDE
ncbi:ArsR family transcriptional regulator [Nocardioides glacieisoli]|uniref:ArsR family transcriptional regulator n=2 Tax=Nocardioides glacieisoli TaxID=1168730 RepID=A0A4Q2RHQ8_9ACTN|nr:ArsR family transcriptional regulator [Nocardioides glacieisoli]